MQKMRTATMAPTRMVSTDTKPIMLVISGSAWPSVGVALVVSAVEECVGVERGIVH